MFFFLLWLDLNVMLFEGNNVNYSTLTNAETSISLRIAPGSFWRKNNDNLPGALTLLAVNTGDGFVAVCPNNAGEPLFVLIVLCPCVYVV